MMFHQQQKYLKGRRWSLFTLRFSLLNLLYKVDFNKYKLGFLWQDLESFDPSELTGNIKSSQKYWSLDN